MCAAGVCSLIHEPDFQHGSLQWHGHPGGAIGTVASHANDRLRGDVPLTHEFLSLILGVRRAGVTVPRAKSADSYARKQIIIVDRNGLRAAGNGIYRQAEKFN
jgi:hypothetical protein